VRGGRRGSRRHQRPDADHTGRRRDVDHQDGPGGTATNLRTPIKASKVQERS
jgi:hypothetical protein